jgi:cytochrome c oxidase assembly protein subunit 11
MPVSFYVDPAIAKDPDAAHVREITLSYTFYPSSPAPTAAPSAGDERKGS